MDFFFAKLVFVKSSPRKNDQMDLNEHMHYVNIEQHAQHIHASLLIWDCASLVSVIPSVYNAQKFKLINGSFYDKINAHVFFKHDLYFHHFWNLWQRATSIHDFQKRRMIASDDFRGFIAHNKITAQNFNQTIECQLLMFCADMKFYIPNRIPRHARDQIEQSHSGLSSPCSPCSPQSPPTPPTPSSPSSQNTQTQAASHFSPSSSRGIMLHHCDDSNIYLSSKVILDAKCSVVAGSCSIFTCVAVDAVYHARSSRTEHREYHPSLCFVLTGSQQEECTLFSSPSDLFQHILPKIWNIECSTTKKSFAMVSNPHTMLLRLCSPTNEDLCNLLGNILHKQLKSIRDGLDVKTEYIEIDLIETHGTKKWNLKSVSAFEKRNATLEKHFCKHFNDFSNTKQKPSLIHIIPADQSKGLSTLMKLARQCDLIATTLAFIAANEISELSQCSEMVRGLMNTGTN